VFLASHEADAVDVVPLWLAPWLLVTMAASLAGCVLALTIYQWLWAGAPELMEARRRARYPCSRCVDGVIAAVWQGRREDSQHAIAAKTQETV
jgi:hypothetical protein